MPLIIRSAAKKVAALTEKEPFFIITLLLTVILSLFSKPHISAINWNVIATMFSLMVICLAFERCKLLTSLAGIALSTFKTPRRLGFAMIFATGILAMFVTNDVALLTVVPLTLMMAKVSSKDPFLLIIFETMSANIFSAITPFGNPQNLYLYSYFKIPASQFFGTMVPFCLFGALFICAANFFFNKGGQYNIEQQKFEIYDAKLLTGACVAFIINILSVLRVVDYRIALIATVIIFLILSPRLLVKADFFLLLTFVLFFLFTDSVTGIPAITSFFSGVLTSKTAVLLTSAGLSQIISNVPAAVVVSGFTTHYKEVLYGVTAGGLGTLVASLASLISYKLYIREYKSRKYLITYFVLNFSVLIVMTAVTVFVD